MANGNVQRVILERSRRVPTKDEPLWVAIRNRTKGIGFDRYQAFIERVITDQTRPPASPEPGVRVKRAEPAAEGYTANAAESPCRSDTSLVAALPRPSDFTNRVQAYGLLKAATEVFLLLQCGIRIDSAVHEPSEEASRDLEATDAEALRNRLLEYLRSQVGADQPYMLPYLRRIVANVFPDEPLIDHPLDYGLLRSRIEQIQPCGPCLLELIWSYWMEEGMLVQSINAATLRFQNRRMGDRDPLAHLEIDPLRPLSNLMWGYIQEEHTRLTVVRRAYEYDHHYGLSLVGRAVPALRSADSRSKFIEGFHTLLNRTVQFLRADDDTTIFADPFPVLQTLKEVHLILAHGAHNQFGDLPWTARVEMMVQQWLMARPEMRDFLQGRPMVPYTEGWMSQVDAMKKLQGWTDTTVTHFRDLAVFGEQLLLSVRYADWIGINDPESAANWARYWRPEIQSYIHAYRAATGEDLTAEPVSVEMPAALLKSRLAAQGSSARR